MPTINMPAELAEIIATHRREFGGFVMEEPPNQPEPPAGNDDGDIGKQGVDGFKSEHSKQSVLADLATARQERNELRAKVEKLEPLAAQLEKLTKALAPESEDGDEQATSDALAAIQKRLDEADLRAAVEALARKHKIDSDEDVALLASIPDAKQREALAVRIAPGDQEPPKSRFFSGPDPSIGKGGGAGSPRTVAEARKEALARRTQTK